MNKAQVDPRLGPALREHLDWAIAYCLKGPVCPQWSSDYVTDCCNGIPFDMQRPHNCPRAGKVGVRWNYESRSKRQGAKA
jgi:hypothetical protein